ncbi:Ribosomal protein L11 methyltransferase [compost metagenome]
MDYTEIAVWVPPLYAESVAWHLQELGVEQLVVSEIPAKGPTPTEVAVKVYRPGATEDHAAWVAELRGLMDRLKEHFPDWTPRVETRLVPEEDWAHSWKQYWHAQEIGERLVVKPSWEAYEGPADKILIELDPKQAFGTGTHPTTQLCLRSLETHVPAHDAPLVFDVGTGSGILAVAAIKLGARHVEACDTDPVAVAATIENIELNGVADVVKCYVGGIETISGTADVLVVNILAEVVAELAQEIADRVRPGGDVIASGIIRERQTLVEEAFEAVGLSVLRVEYQGEWVVIEARKPESFVIERKG